MGKASKKMKLIKAQQSGPPEKKSPTRPNKFPLWKGLVTSLIALIVFIILIEVVLGLFGVEPELRKEDPFVGFASNIPLFVKTTEPDGRDIMATAANKYEFFNRQRFPLKKAPETYRIFTLGGSTTYGRPYNDKTSFSGWLRKLLLYTDIRRRWEVINAGGISYASYRIAHLMEELVRYEPDLFIIYTGHNEFLEERTYAALRDTPAVVRTAAELLSHTRTWSAMSTVLSRLNVSSSSKQVERDELSGEVKTILDRSIGLNHYKRDDALQDRILQHYRLSLERMVDIARAVGADIIFVTPASNLKDSSPFKSQHTEGLSEGDLLRSEELLSTAMRHIQSSEWSVAIEKLDEAISLDPRFSEYYYRRGKILFALGRHDEAARAFRRARDEDVCPLRAITPMREILTEVARENSVTVVDFIDLIEQRLQGEYSHTIPGEEYFLDHVHPTIEGNRLLAIELVETIADMGVVTPAYTWGGKAIAEVTARVEGGLNKKEHAKALVNLVRVLNWAGKYEDAIRIAKQVLTSGVKDPEVIREAATFSATISMKHGDIKGAMRYYQKALKAVPGNPETHLNIGRLFMKEPFQDLKVASAHALLTSVYVPDNDLAHYTFGLAMAERGRYALAYPSVMDALRLNPMDAYAKMLLERLRKLLVQDYENLTLAKVALDKYQSGAPFKMVQVRPDSTGNELPDGIWTEWYENGMLKSFIDYEKGVKHGIEIHWDPDGELTSRDHWKQGVHSEETGTEAEVLNSP